MLVLDASVAVKMFQVETGSDARDVYLRHFGELAAPDIFAVEVAGAFVRIANMTKTALPAMQDALTGFQMMLRESAIVLWPTTVPMLTTASQIALDLGHPLKDCLYLALSAQREWPLLTADAKFTKRALSHGHQVQLLGE